MKVDRSDIWLCLDCLIVAVNGDTTSLTYHYGEKADEREAEITAGLERLGPHLVPDYDSESGEGIEEFSRHGCDCCASSLAGERHRFATLVP